MKLNNKGFAISSIMYIILVMAILIITVTLSVLSSRKLVLDKLRSEVSNKINQDIDFSYKDTLKAIKVATQSYIDSGHSIDDTYVDSISIESLKNDKFLSVSDKVLNYYNLSDKYVGFKNNNSTYSFMIGKEVDYNNLKGELLDITDYHIEGESTQSTRSGKNLFNVNGAIEQFAPNNYPTTVVDNQIHIGPTEGNSQSSLFDFIKVSPNDKITVSFKLIQGRSRISFRMYDSSKTIINDSSISISGFSYNKYYQGYYKDTNSATFTIPENVEYIRMQIIAMNNSDGIDNIYSEYQVEKGSSPTSYEEYGKSPSPEYPSEIKNVGNYDTETGKYIIPIKITSKNIFNINDWYNTYYSYYSNDYKPEFVNYDGYSTLHIYGSMSTDGANNKYMKEKFKSKTQYTFSMDIYSIASPDNGYEGTMGNIVYTDGTKQRFLEADKIFDKWRKIKVTSYAGKTISHLQFTYYTGRGEAYIKNMQIEEGNQQTYYIPYVEDTINNISLDEPLKKIGEYADNIDYKNKKRINKTNEITLNGTENWIVYPSTNKYYITDVLPTLYEKNKLVLSNLFLGKTSGDSSNAENNYNYVDGDTWIQSRSEYPRLYIYKGDINTVAELKAFLASNNPKFLFALKDPTQNDISLPNIVVRGGNKIEVDTSVKPSNTTYKVIEKMFDINV